MSNTIHPKSILIVHENVDVWLEAKKSLSEHPQISWKTQADLSKIVDQLREKKFDLVVVPLAMDEPITTLELLRLIKEDKSLQQPQVSVIVSSHQKQMLPTVMEQGALSYHMAGSFFDPSHHTLDLLFQRLEAYKGDFRLVASSYIREYLISTGEIEALLQFDIQLSRYYPLDPEILMNVAHSQAANQNWEQSLSCLQQVVAIDDRYLEIVNDFSQEYLNGKSLDSEISCVPLNNTGVKSCMIIEPDFKSAKKVYELLGELGIRQISLFKHPYAALKYATNTQAPDLVISEKTLPDIPFQVVAQRLNQLKPEGIPIIVLGDKFSKEQIEEFEDLNVGSALQKPIEAKSLYKVLAWSSKDIATPSSVNLLVQLAIFGIRNGNQEDILKWSNLLRKNQNYNGSDILTLQGEVGCEFGEYALAQAYALKALDIKPNSPRILTLLGRSLVGSGHMASGIRCLENACLQSPYNGQRMIHLAEAYLAKGDLPLYKSAHQRAMTILGRNTMIVELELKYLVSINQTEEAEELAQELSNLRFLVRWSHCQALSFFKEKKFKQAIHCYKKTLRVLPKYQRDLRSTLYFYLGIAYGRENKLFLAEENLVKAQRGASDDISARLGPMLQKVQHSIASQEPFILAEQREDLIDKKIKQIFESPIQDMDPVFGCYKIFFQTTHLADPKASEQESLLTNRRDRKAS